jgi:hypothetical protein
MMLLRWFSERKPYFDACQPEYMQALKDVSSIIDQPMTPQTDIDIRVDSSPLPLVRCRCVGCVLLAACV